MNIIPTNATVTLPAKDFYELSTKLAEQEDAKAKFLTGIIVETSGAGSPTVKLPKHPFAPEIVERVVETLVIQPNMITRLARKDEHYYDPAGMYFSSYDWEANYDLLNYPKFAAAWKIAKDGIEDEEGDEND